MKIKNSSFKTLVENRITRYRIGSFLVGDQVKILDTIKSIDAYKELPIASREVLDNFIELSNNGDIILKIAGLNQTPFLQGTPEATPMSFDLGADLGGGFYGQVLTLPATLIRAIERINVDPNNVAQTIPANSIISYPCHTEPVEVTPEILKGNDEQAIPTEQPVHQLPKTNTALPASTVTSGDYSKAIKSKMKIGNVQTKNV